MPQLSQSNIEELTLPTNPDDPIKVTVDTAVTGGMAEDVIGEDGKISKPISAIITNAIKSWNVTDADGNPEPVTQESVRRMEPDDFMFLGNKILDKLNVAIEAKAVSTAEKKG